MIDYKNMVWTVAQDGANQVFVMAYHSADTSDHNFSGPAAFGATPEEAILIALTDVGVHYDDAFDLAVTATWKYLGARS